jgi:hypothetical protein
MRRILVRKLAAVSAFLLAAGPAIAGPFATTLPE